MRMSENPYETNYQGKLPTRISKTYRSIFAALYIVGSCVLAITSYWLAVWLVFENAKFIPDKDALFYFRFWPGSLVTLAIGLVAETHFFTRFRSRIRLHSKRSCLKLVTQTFGYSIFVFLTTAVFFSFAIS